jgi:hypothetical protein
VVALVKFRNHYFICCAIFLYFISRFFINETSLPDYEAYKAIYNMRASNYESVGSDLFFVYFVKFFYYLNFSYESFRFALVLISLFLIVFSSLLFVKYKKWMFISDKTKLSDFFICIVLFFSTYIFLFEFYSIRLRGGLSLSFFYAFSVFFIIRKKSLLFYFLSVLFLYMSFGTHLSTAITLFGFLTVPTILFLNLKFFSRIIGVRLYFLLAFWLSVLSGFFIVFGMIYFSTFRGEHLNSKLNFVRFLFMSVVPLLIYFFVDMRKINNSIRLYYYLLQEKGYDKELLSRYPKEIWIYFITNAYVGCAIALIFFYSIGMLSTAGEAVIRVFTLSSVSSLLVLSLQKNKINLFWFFVIFSNSMFFFNTVFL